MKLNPSEMNIESESKTRRELMLCGVYVEDNRFKMHYSGAVINPWLYLIKAVLFLQTLSFFVHVLGAQSCPVLCDPMDCRPPDSSVHGTL